VRVIVVGIQEIPMTYYKVNNGVLFAAIALICITGQISRIATKNIENLSPVVITRWHLIVGIIVPFTPWSCKSFYFIAFRVFNQTKIRISISP